MLQIFIDKVFEKFPKIGLSLAFIIRLKPGQMHIKKVMCISFCIIFLVTLPLPQPIHVLAVGFEYKLSEKN